MRRDRVSQVSSVFRTIPHFFCDFAQDKPVHSANLPDIFSQTPDRQEHSTFVPSCESLCAPEPEQPNPQPPPRGNCPTRSSGPAKTTSNSRLVITSSGSPFSQASAVVRKDRVPYSRVRPKEGIRLDVSRLSSEMKRIRSRHAGSRFPELGGGACHHARPASI